MHGKVLIEHGISVIECMVKCCSTLHTVLPQRPKDVQYKHLKPTSVQLCWEQLYSTEDEKPTKYHIEVAHWPNLSHEIDPAVRDVSSNKATCEYILDGLRLGTTYDVVIIAESEDGKGDSEKVLLTTKCKSNISHL